jgi:hypothetical protein
MTLLAEHVENGKGGVGCERHGGIPRIHYNNFENIKELFNLMECLIRLPLWRYANTKACRVEPKTVPKQQHFIIN